MLLSAVSVLVVAQSSSEIPEGLMNNPVYIASSDSEVEKQEGILNTEGRKDSKEGDEHCKFEFSKAINCNIC